MTVSAALVELDGVTRRLDGARTPVLSGVSFTLETGRYAAIVGESGVGKSTLLNVIAGLEPVDAGRVVVNGVALVGLADAALSAFRRQHLGFVFQSFHVLPYLSVEANVALPLRLLSLADAECRARVEAALAAVGLEACARRAPATLSGGELQRVAIARALVHRPALVLADEPTGNLDPRLATDVLCLLRTAIKTHGSGGLLVTHSAAAAASADVIYRFDGESLAEQRTF